MASAVSKFIQGSTVDARDENFLVGVRAAVDYRGDVSLVLADGNRVEGYIYSHSSDRLDLFPKNSPRAISVNLGDIQSLTFSGEDTASGKSFEDWVQKKESEKAAIKAQPIELA